MKKNYVAPRAEKMEYNYSDKVTASGMGNAYQEHIHTYSGCHDTPTNNWFIGQVRENGCKQM